ncbi:MAG: hypothetical protein ACYS47_22050 [Planctomycetota bacterium]|jgi:hypothetical protein
MRSERTVIVLFPEGRIVRAVTLLFLFLCSLTVGAADRHIETIDFAGIAPQDITTDTSGEQPSYWVTSLLDGKIFHYDAGWALLDEPVPITFLERLTGIAYNSDRGTLFLADPVVRPGDFEKDLPPILRIVEIKKDGTEPTWRNFSLDPVVNPGGQPAVWGLAYVPASGIPAVGGAALLIFESVAAKVYCFALDGTRLFSFVHVDDPDGHPGRGLGVRGGGILPVLSEEGRLIGVEFTGYREDEYVIYRAEITEQLEAVYHGHYIPLPVLPGQAAGFDRGLWKDPTTGADSFS